MRSGVSRDRERFPELREQLGEDPARWLDWSIPGERDRERMVRTRIESIDRIEVIRAWKAVERRLGRGEDGGPRSGIVQALDEREAVLEEIGERPDRLVRREGSRDLPDVDEASDRAVYSRPRRFGTGEAVATDGREPEA